jgi:hypothetical protein
LAGIGIAEVGEIFFYEGGADVVLLGSGGDQGVHLLTLATVIK